MNVTKTLTALSIAAGLACSISAQNLLENAGFEDGLNGWKTDLVLTFLLTLITFLWARYYLAKSGKFIDWV